MAVVAGYCLVWSDRARLDDHWERFERHAFGVGPIPTNLRLGHDPRTYGAYAWGVRALPDHHGLRFEARLTDDARSRQLVAAIRYSNLDQVSFAFVKLDSSWADDEETISRARLKEISICGDACYRAGGVWVRGDESHLTGRLRALADAYARSKPLQPVGRAIGAKPPRRPAAIAAGHNPPQAPSVVGVTVCRPTVDPVRLAVWAYMARYMAHYPNV